MLNIRKGGHKDLEHYFTLIEMDFDSEEIIPRIAIHKGIMNGSIEMLVAYDEDSGMDAGYALVAPRSFHEHLADGMGHGSVVVGVYVEAVGSSRLFQTTARAAHYR